MSGLNVWLISGYLGKDPDFQISSKGNPFAKFSIAVDGYSNGGKTTMWVNIVAFGQVAETVEKFCSKGTFLIVQGKAQVDEWKDRETGVNRSSISLVATQITFGPKVEKKEEKVYRNKNEEPSPDEIASMITGDFDPELP